MSLIHKALATSALTFALASGLAALPAAAQEIDIVELTIGEIQAAFAAGTYTSEELTQAYLDRIAAYEPYYNAFVVLNPEALAEAKAIDERRAAGETLGPLAGVPVVVKEAMDLAGFPSTAGWDALSSAAGGIDLIPEVDAPVVARLRAAGAIILGKTNIPTFSDSGTDANSSWDGPTFNAVNRDFAPGGSSAGSATAVSGSFAVVGLAEETGGSIQNPAGAQSLVGIKPSFGLVPNSGVTPLAGSTRDVVGPLARTVRDAAIVLDVLAGYTIDDPKTTAAIGNVPADGYTSGLSTTALEGMRIGLYGPGWRKEELSEEAQALYDKAVAALEAEGATVITDPFAGSGFADLGPADLSYDPRGSDALAYDLELYLKRLGESAAANSVEELNTLLEIDPLGEDGPLSWYVTNLPVLAASVATPTVAPDISDFIALRQSYLTIFNAVMAEQDLDALMFPQVKEAAPGIFADGSINATTVSEINIAGLPGVIVPSGAFENGAPFGVIFVGPMWSEPELLGYAYDYEDAVRGRIVPPELDTTPYPVPQQQP